MQSFINHCTNILNSSCIFLYPCPLNIDNEAFKDENKLKKELDKLRYFYNKLGFTNMEIPLKNYSVQFMYMLI